MVLWCVAATPLTFELLRDEPGEEPDHVGSFLSYRADPLGGKREAVLHMRVSSFSDTMHAYVCCRMRWKGAYRAGVAEVDGVRVLDPRFCVHVVNDVARCSEYYVVSERHSYGEWTRTHL